MLTFPELIAIYQFYELILNLMGGVFLSEKENHLNDYILIKR